MEAVALTIIILAAVVVFFHYGIKVWIYYKDSHKPESEMAEFMIDLFKNQCKWEKRGRLDYANAFRMIINAFNLPPRQRPAETEYGRTVQEYINKINAEEENEQ